MPPLPQFTDTPPRRRPKKPPYDPVGGPISVPDYPHDLGLGHPEKGTLGQALKSSLWIPIAVILTLDVIGGILMSFNGYAVEFWDFHLLILRLVVLIGVPVGTIAWLFFFHRDRQFIPWLIPLWLVFGIVLFTLP